MNHHVQSPPVTGVILAGGRGTRMDGLDKGLVVFRKRALIEHAIDRFKPQVNELLINANRNHERYAAYGFPVVTDEHAGYQGPLAGMLAAIPDAVNPHVVFVPCDMPDLPRDLVQRLVHKIQSTGSMAAYAHDGEFPQPVCMAMKTEMRPLLNDWLSSGQRKARDWLREINAVRVDFSDCPDAFININTLSERE